MAKLYKAIDKLDGRESVFLVTDFGVATSFFSRSIEDEIDLAKLTEDSQMYVDIERFSDAINPELIAEW